MKKNHFYQLLFPCLLCAFMLCLAGCNNDEYADVSGDSSNEYMPVEVSFGGMETLFGPYGEEARNVQYNKIHETQDFGKNRMLETLVMAEPDTLRPPLTRSTSAVTNTTLRIVAYDESNATYMGTGAYNIDAGGKVTARSGEELILKSGKYYFHCISPAQAVSVSDNKITIALPTAGGTTNPGIYYAKTSAAVQLTMNDKDKAIVTIPTLQPTCCKLTLSVSHSKGYTTTYSNAVLATTFYKGGSLALPAGTVTSNTPVTSTTIASSSPTIYTYPGVTGSFKMTVNSVFINGGEYATISTDANTTGMTLATGNAYKVSVSIQPPNWIKIGDLPFRVAKSNLLYNSGTGKWYLAPDQGYYCPVQNGGYETLSNNNSGYGSSGQKVFSYISWGTRAKSPNFSLTSSGPYADAYGGETQGTHWGTKFGYSSKNATSAGTPVSYYKNNNDPCYAALGGTWHVPTGTDDGSDTSKFYTAINTSSTRKFKTYTTQANLCSKVPRIVYGIYFGTSTQPSIADQDKYVFLPAAGYRICESGVIEDEGEYGKAGMWCSQRNHNLDDFADKLTIDQTYSDRGMALYRCASGALVRCIGF